MWDHNFFFFGGKITYSLHWQLKGFEFIKAVHLDPIPFDMERDLLTPTYKKKRSQFLRYYQVCLFLVLTIFIMFHFLNSMGRCSGNLSPYHQPSSRVTNGITTTTTSYLLLTNRSELTSVFAECHWWSVQKCKISSRGLKICYFAPRVVLYSQAQLQLPLDLSVLLGYNVTPHIIAKQCMYAYVEEHELLMRMAQKWIPYSLIFKYFPSNSNWFRHGLHIFFLNEHNDGS